jgi:hypothetical protein
VADRWYTAVLTRPRKKVMPPRRPEEGMYLSTAQMFIYNIF